MLNLSSEERSQLNMDGSLVIDADGNEILVGLTARESNFVLVHQRKFDDRQCLKQQHVYLMLRQRHATAHKAARLMLAMLVEGLRRSAPGSIADYSERVIQHLDTELSLDHALGESFPASDPVAISITSKERNLWALVGNDFRWLATRR